MPRTPGPSQCWPLWSTLFGGVRLKIERDIFRQCQHEYQSSFKRAQLSRVMGDGPEHSPGSSIWKHLLFSSHFPQPVHTCHLCAHAPQVCTRSPIPRFLWALTPRDHCARLWDDKMWGEDILPAPQLAHNLGRERIIRLQHQCVHRNLHWPRSDGRETQSLEGDIGT